MAFQEHLICSSSSGDALGMAPAHKQNVCQCESTMFNYCSKSKHILLSFANKSVGMGRQMKWYVHSPCWSSVADFRHRGVEENYKILEEIISEERLKGFVLILLGAV